MAARFDRLTNLACARQRSIFSREQHDLVRLSRWLDGESVSRRVGTEECHFSPNIGQSTAQIRNRAAGPARFRQQAGNEVQDFHLTHVLSLSSGSTWRSVSAGAKPATEVESLWRRVSRSIANRPKMKYEK